MRVELTAKQEAFIQDQVATGDFKDATDVVSQALVLLQAYLRGYWADVNRQVAEGLADIEAGRTVPAEEAIARARALVLEKARKKQMTNG